MAKYRRGRGMESGETFPCGCDFKWNINDDGAMVSEMKWTKCRTHGDKRARDGAVLVAYLVDEERVIQVFHGKDALSARIVCTATSMPWAGAIARALQDSEERRRKKGV